MEGPVAASLLRLAAARGVYAELAAQLLSQLHAGHDQAPRPVQLPHSGEALTSREVEVLRLIVAGASNRAIADRLVISEHTVKAHITNILGKLEVRSRTEAAARARELYLV